MSAWDAVIKQARDCHTKQAWEQLFDVHGDAIAASGHSKVILELFRMLKADPQSLQYDPRIFGRLVQGCLASWNLELGREIVDFAKRIPSAAVSIPAAQLFLESGHPTQTREIANRALRLTGLTPAEKLSLEMLIASSYAEEGKRQKTIRALNQIRALVASPALGAKDRADFLNSMGRMQFLLGRYQQAAELFYDASRLYLQLQDWEASARMIFNTAVCQLNSGSRRRDEAFAMIEECRRLSEAHELFGPLSHCEAAYGMDAYHHGDFAAAREHLRRALEYLPISDKSYRRLHILSALSLTYLAMGRYHLARKFGRQTFDLSALGESERFKIRYTTLRAELTWEDGLIDDAQAQLRAAVAPLETGGVHTLEDLATVARYNLQAALVNATQPPGRFAVDDSLKKNQFAYCDLLFAEGQLALNRGERDGAERRFSECLTRARQMGDRYHEALAILGQLQSKLRARETTELDAPVREFEVIVARLGETPLKMNVLMINAARAYHAGQFSECEHILRLANKLPRQSFADRFVVQGWLATIEGRSSRLSAGWQTNVVARFTRTYFAPTLAAVDDRHFQVSEHYLVSLERHPALADLLHYLMLKSNFAADGAEIQAQVWKQSLATQGWQQKIRNTIMRLRDFFPYTIAPLIVHADQVALFKDAIAIQPTRREGLLPDQEIMRLLADAPMSSQRLAERLQLSSATTKRILKRLADDHLVTPVKEGRNVYYRLPEGRAAAT